MKINHNKLIFNNFLTEAELEINRQTIIHSRTKRNTKNQADGRIDDKTKRQINEKHDDGEKEENSEKSKNECFKSGEMVRRMSEMMVMVNASRIIINLHHKVGIIIIIIILITIIKMS